MPLSFQPLYTDATVDVVQAHSLVVVHWKAAPNVAALEGFAPRLEATVTRSPGTSIMAHATGFPGLPDEATRKAAAGFLRRVTASARAAAFAIEEQGFRAAAARAAVGGLLMIVRPSIPVKIFGTLDGAVDWIFPHLTMPGESVGTLAAAIRKIGPT